ncbi:MULTISPECIES: hypothetical protein [unclassified Mesorhizobium]|uniref:hypothetical protein n=1 Tax=unclassified Mesorhizobium TaxID=325217 RepID=UPI00163D55F6|nr:MULTISPECIES: hypothetical protein [unclassified Mesorhizobium]
MAKEQDRSVLEEIPRAARILLWACRDLLANGNAAVLGRMHVALPLCGNGMLSPKINR